MANAPVKINIPQQDGKAGESKGGLKFVKFSANIDGTDWTCLTFGDLCKQNFERYVGKDDVLAFVKEAKNPLEKIVSFAPDQSNKYPRPKNEQPKAEGSVPSSAKTVVFTPSTLDLDTYMVCFENLYRRVSNLVLSDLVDKKIIPDVSSESIISMVPGFLDAVEKMTVHLSMAMSPRITIGTTNETKEVAQTTGATVEAVPSINVEAASYITNAENAIIAAPTEESLNVIRTRIASSKRVNDEQRNALIAKIDAKIKELGSL